MPPPRRQLDLSRATAALVEHEPSGVTMDTVARSLGVAKPTLYRLARSREDLIRRCADAEGDRLLERMHTAYGASVGFDPGRRVVAGFVAFFGYARESPAGFELLFGRRYPEAREAVRRVEDRLRELLRSERITAGRDLPNAELLAAALLGAAGAVTTRIGEDAGSLDPDAVAGLIGSAIVEGW